LEWGYSGISRMAQPFTVSSNCYVTAVAVNARQVNSPVDSPVVAIYDDSGGAPNAVLETGSSLSVGGSFAWATSTFSGTTLLSAGNTYYIVWDRTGSYDNTNRYTNEANNNAVPYGAIQSSNLSTWTSYAGGSGYNNLFLVIDDIPPSSGSSTATSTVMTTTDVLASAFLLAAFFTVFWSVFYVVIKFTV